MQTIQYTYTYTYIYIHITYIIELVTYFYLCVPKIAKIKTNTYICYIHILYLYDVPIISQSMYYVDKFLDD